MSVLAEHECRHWKHCKTACHIPYEVPCKPWEVVGADIFSIKDYTLLCIEDYYSKFPNIRKADSLAANDLVKTAKIVFTKFGLPKKIISDAGTNFALNTFKQFCRQMNIEQTIASSYHHHSSRQVEACIRFVKQIITNTLIIMMWI